MAAAGTGRTARPAAIFHLAIASRACQGAQFGGHCLAFLLKADWGVLRVTLDSSGVSLFTGQDETAEHLLAIRWAAAAGEAAEVAAQMTEETLGQVGGAQAVTPARRPAQ